MKAVYSPRGARICSGQAGGTYELLCLQISEADTPLIGAAIPPSPRPDGRLTVALVGAVSPGVQLQLLLRSAQTLLQHLSTAPARPIGGMTDSSHPCTNPGSTSLHLIEPKNYTGRRSCRSVSKSAAWLQNSKIRMTLVRAVSNATHKL